MLQAEAVQIEEGLQPIKCVVWDLDHTLWHGVLLEDESVTLRSEISSVIQELDRRGILQSVSSKNDFRTAKQKLEEFGLWEYFLYPQINWGAKSASIRAISELLNISVDSFAFVDDQAFERDEVQSVNPKILCIDADQIAAILSLERMNPRFLTETSLTRRRLYQSDIQRKQAEETFAGTNEEFLATLNLEFEIKIADEGDLQRAEELTIRTHQLNSTGYTYSYDELNQIRTSNDHILLVSKLNDRYGTYGTIGLCLVEKQHNYWVIKLLLMSCRVMSRGVGSVMLSYIMGIAKANGVKIRAEFLPTDVNRMMFITYKFAGFKEVEKSGELLILEHETSIIPPTPRYVFLSTPDSL